MLVVGIVRILVKHKLLGSVKEELGKLMNCTTQVIMLDYEMALSGLKLYEFTLRNNEPSSFQGVSHAAHCISMSESSFNFQKDQISQQQLYIGLYSQ